MLEHTLFLINNGRKVYSQRQTKVAGGHKMTLLLSITHSIVVTSKSVRLVFLIFGLNNLDICACYIGKCISQCSMLGKTVDQNRIRIWERERIHFTNCKMSLWTETIRGSLDIQACIYT